MLLWNKYEDPNFRNGRPILSENNSIKSDPRNSRAPTVGSINSEQDGSMANSISERRDTFGSTKTVSTLTGSVPVLNYTPPKDEVYIKYMYNY